MKAQQNRKIISYVYIYSYINIYSGQHILVVIPKLQPPRHLSKMRHLNSVVDSALGSFLMLQKPGQPAVGDTTIHALVVHGSRGP